MKIQSEALYKNPRGRPVYMAQLNELLNGPEYFYCEKGKCKLRIDICIARQKANQQRKPFKALAFPICEECSQGAKNKLLAEAGNPMEPGKPKRGKGQRNKACRLYSECLGIAAKKDWKTFNCESCPNYKPGLKKPENKRVCEDCGKKTTITPKHALCASCLGKKPDKPKKAKKSGVVRSNKRNAGQPIDKPEKACRGQNTALTIEFGKHVSILREVEKLAEEEVRSVEWQVIYMLKKAAKNLTDK